MTGPTFTKAEYERLEAAEVNIVVVGHNQMMMEYCQQGQPPKPNNNAVLEKLFIVNRTLLHSDGGAVTMLRELAGRCAKVMDAPDGKVSMSQLLQADVSTCTEPFEVAKFIGATPGEAPSGGTPCMRLA